MFNSIENFSFHLKQTIKLSLPLIMAQLGQIIVGIVDNLMVGHLGWNELAAAAFANNIFNIAIIFSMGFSYIITPLVGHARGNKNDEKALFVFKNGLLANILLAIIVTIILFVLMGLFPYMHQPKQIVRPAQIYFSINTLSLLFVLFFFGFKQFAEGVGDTKTGMYIVLIGNVLNILANWLFIYGIGIFPEIGLYGAAVGSFISRVFMAVAFCWFFFASKKYAFYRDLFLKQKIVFSELIKIARKGFSVGCQTIMECSAFALAGIMMGWIGAKELAAHQIAISVSSFGFMLYQGVASAAAIRISNYWGRKQKKEAKDSATVAAFLVILMVIFTASLFFFGRTQIAACFNDDPNVVKIAALFMIVLASFQLFDALQVIYGAALRALADVRVPVIITFISFFCLSLMISYLSAFKFGFGAVGVWFGFPIGLATSFLLYFLRFRKMIKLK